MLRLGAEVTDFTQDEAGVMVHVGDETISAQWLVGCDGGRSTVRKRAGFEFVGTDPELTGYLAMVDIADPEKLKPGWNLTDTGMYVNGPAPGRIGVTEFDSGAADRDAPITLEAMQARLRRVSGTDVTLTTMHVATRYTDNVHQVTTYRMGRVLLAGDAAHVHSPLGGQGMNLGIGDAMNLDGSWPRPSRAGLQTTCWRRIPGSGIRSQPGRSTGHALKWRSCVPDRMRTLYGRSSAT